jgi:hypothetical protein
VSATHLYFATNNVNGNPTASVITAANVITTNQWNHVVFTQYTIAGTRFWSLYCNGDRVYHAATTDNINVSSAGWTHHTGYYPGNAISYDYNGYISDLKISKSALYTSSSYTIPTSPLENTSAYLYLPMDNAGIFDKTGNNTFTLVGNTSTSTTQTKYADTAMYFDGTGDYVQISQSELYNFGTTDFTIEMWIKPNVSSGFGGLFSIDAGPFPSVLIYNSGSNNIRIYLSDSNTSFDLTHDVAIPSTEWHHLAFTRNGDIFRSFLNGSIINATTLSLDIKPQRAQARLGSGDSGLPWNGYIENFQILKGVAKYTTNFTPPTQEQGRTYQATS